MTTAMLNRVEPSTHEGPDGSIARMQRGWAVVCLSVVAIAAAWFLLLHAYFYYHVDDIYQFSVARAHGLSWTLLSLNVFAHFGPFDRFLHWTVLKSRLDPDVGIAIATALFTALLLSVQWLLSELQVSRRRQVIGLWLLGLSMPMLQSGAWADAAFHSLPAMTATVGVLAAHARGLRFGRWRWHVVACLLLATGLLTQERVAVVVALAVMMDVLIIWRNASWTEAMRLLWGTRWPLLALAAVGVPAALVIEHFYAFPGLHPSLSVAVQLVFHAYVDYFYPGLVAVYHRGPMPLAIAVAVHTGVVLAAVAVCRFDRSNVRPIAFFLIAFVIYYAPLAFSPLIVNGVDDNVRRLDYAAYPLVALVIAVSSMRLPAVPRGWIRTSQQRRLAAIGSAAVALTALLATDVIYLHDRNGIGKDMQSFVREVRANQQAWASNDLTLLPVDTPLGIACCWATAYGREQYFLGFIDPGYTQGAITGPPAVINDTGHVEPVALATETAAPDGSRWSSAELGSIGGGRVSAEGLACNDPRNPAGFLRMLLPQPVAGAGPEYAVIDYRADRDTEVRMTTVDADGSFVINNWPSHLRAGGNRLVIASDASHFAAIQLSDLAPGTSLCVRNVTIVRPVLPADGAQTCSVINIYGAPADRVPCAGARAEFPQAQRAR